MEAQRQAGATFWWLLARATGFLQLTNHGASSTPYSGVMGACDKPNQRQTACKSFFTCPRQVTPSSSSDGASGEYEYEYEYE
jgi:hypothetical protein